MNIQVIHHEEEHIIRLADSDEKWRGNDTFSEHIINGYCFSDKYFDFILSDELIKDKPDLYLVYVLYDTGNSFHRAENKLCLVGLFTSMMDAIHLRAKLEINYKKFPKDNTPIEVTYPSNVKETISTGDWKGYFERLRSVEIEVLHYIN